ncbi:MULTISPECIES: hypothetical protein [Mycobacteroides]|nr:MULTISPECIES: hypothetical protein [Mycobacteroides]MBF9350626.1 hypothetical protein [Mycobacteroides chelonae]SIM48962.1 Uncharacterised protein [Mycobacteroides abscessus subsp. abscessus]SLC89437.1 Uncharacterised protein [Mycobacteroides abscessus subsp. abscessus]
MDEFRVIWTDGQAGYAAYVIDRPKLFWTDHDPVKALAGLVGLLEFTKET